MRTSLYIVPTTLLSTNRPNAGHTASPFPADPTQSLLRVDWGDDNAEREFEALPGVAFLGFPWEPLPDYAANLISSIAQEEVPASRSSNISASIGEPIQPLSVARALQGIAWARP